MSDFLDAIRGALFGRAMDRLPAETPVRGGFGLEGASIQPSDFADQLRNADRKEAVMPLGPKRFFSPEQSEALNAAFGVPKTLRAAPVKTAAEAAGPSPSEIDQFLRHASKEELQSILGEFKGAKLLRRRNEIFKREFGR